MAKYLYGWTTEEDKKFWDLYYKKVCQEVKPKEHAVDVIEELSKNNSIFIITARWEDENGLIEKTTKEWLKKYNIKYNKFLMGYLDKKEVAKENELDLFIDDSIKNCMELSSMGIKTFMMNTRVNEKIKCDNIERVFNWKEIEEKIKCPLGNTSPIKIAV